jgi:hypothetical protein
VNHPLGVLVTGIEHSGTTLLSLLLGRHPQLCGGFECGLLLADSPKDFAKLEPWHQWMMDPIEIGHWGIPKSAMHEITESADWAGAYQKIIEHSPLFGRPDQRVIDKSPRYRLNLSEILDKVPEEIRCLVIEKTLENLWLSFRKRTDFEDYAGRCRLYRATRRRALAKHGDRIRIIRYENLCTRVVEEMRAAFSFLELEFREEFVPDAVDIEEYYRVGTDVCLPDEELRAIENLRKELSSEN